MSTLAQIASPVVATLEVLSAASLVDEALGGAQRVYAGQIPTSVMQTLNGHPPRCIEIASAGSSALTSGSGDTGHVPVSVWRIDLRCYGRTRTEADLAAIAARHVLKQWVSGRTSGNALVHWFHRTSGPVPITTPDTGWPISVVSFQLQMADELIPA